ncbi:MAG: NADH-quinone oxidoreductase subunit C [Actinomycetota bacterium]
MERVVGDDALERVQDELGDLITEPTIQHGHVHINCAPANLVEVATRLRDGDKTRCRFFGFIGGIDWSEYGDEDNDEHKERRATPFEVLVQLYSPDFTITVNIHVPLEGDKPSCPSLTGVFGGANWTERETHEMFGITFPGHPGLVSLYLPEDFEGHPLLKSFKLPTRIVKPWPGAKDPEEAAGGR